MTPLPKEARPIVFLGSPEPAAVVLAGLLSAGFVIDHVVTRPDARRGRGSATSPTPVKRVALEHGIDVVHDLGRLRDNVDVEWLGVVVAYGRIIPPDILAATKMINLHFSLLPRWRGAAPVERAILAGDERTGVCIMDVDVTLDTGAVYACRELAIRPDHDAATLTSDLAMIGTDLLVSTLREGLGRPEAQTGEATYANKVTTEEALIDWSKDASVIERQVRALRSHTMLDGSRLKILKVRVLDDGPDLSPGECDSEANVGTGNGTLSLMRVQPEARQAMDAMAWRRGQPSTSLRFTGA